MSLFIGCSIFYAPYPAHACDCVAPTSAKEELSRSKAVFSGKVLKVNEKRSLRGSLTKSVIFEVKETWEG